MSNPFLSRIEWRLWFARSVGSVSTISCAICARATWEFTKTGRDGPMIGCGLAAIFFALLVWGAFSEAWSFWWKAREARIVNQTVVGPASPFAKPSRTSPKDSFWR